jgi:chloramphenicol O-acetyltransferase
MEEIRLRNNADTLRISLVISCKTTKLEIAEQIDNFITKLNTEKGKLIEDAFSDVEQLKADNEEKEKSKALLEAMGLSNTPNHILEKLRKKAQNMIEETQSQDLYTKLIESGFTDEQICNAIFDPYELPF